MQTSSKLSQNPLKEKKEQRKVMGINSISGEASSVDVKKRIIKELVRGRSMATQLQILLRNPGSRGNGYGFNSPHNLIAQISSSFTETLSVLGSRHDSSVWEDLTHGKKGSTNLKGKRGCSKRRKSSQTRTIVASTIEDDYAWRKYGQKEILNAKYPRSYFRCTHKHDRNCKAIKQVQRMEENPQMYEITYIDVHTCTDLRKPSPQMMEDAAPSFLDNIESFDKRQDHFLFNASSVDTAPVKLEETKEDAKSELTDNVSREIDSFLVGDIDLLEGSSRSQGLEMDFLLDAERVFMRYGI